MTTFDSPEKKATSINCGKMRKYRFLALSPFPRQVSTVSMENLDQIAKMSSENASNMDKAKISHLVKG